MAGKVGLALGGGAVLGAAHVGVLEVIEDAGIRVDCVAGTSIGALVAALYAYRVPVAEIRRRAEALSWLDFSRPKLSRLGVLTNQRMERVVEDAIGERRIEDADRQLAIVTTDISDGEQVVLRQGDVGRAVVASTCLPGVFEPVRWDEHLLVDGGLSENVPVSPLLAMGCDRIIAVDLLARRGFDEPKDMIDVVSNAIDIAILHASRRASAAADIHIEPDLAGFNARDTDQVPALIERGREAAVSVLGDADLPRDGGQRPAKRRNWFSRLFGS